MTREYDLVVVGPGSAGIVAAGFAARLGVKVAAVERGRVGGDCLWTGCVPEQGGALVLITVRGRLVGAHALAPAAGELINELGLAIRHRLKLHELGGLVHVYPTISTSIVMLGADAAYARAERFSWLIPRR